MGRKSREKRQKRDKKALASDEGGHGEVSGSGDLRLIEAHVENFVAGMDEAEAALKILGRDASFTVVKIGEQLKNDKVIELGKKLVAVKPQMETNLYELREDSLVQVVQGAASDAPLATDGGDIPDQYGGVAIFDPIRVADALVKGGRPRTDETRVAAGDIAWFSIERSPVALTVGDLPEDQETAERALVVDSGVLFIGPPEAADGPRLGTVRIDPFSTALDEHLDRGALRRLKAGAYTVHAYEADGTLQLHVIPLDSA